MKPVLHMLICVVCMAPVYGQIAQSHPEYCGFSGNINPPLLDISATIDRNNDNAVLYLGRGGSAIPLNGSPIVEIAEVCPLSDGRLVVLGDMRAGFAVYIIDTTKATIIDWFWGFDSVISPDQRSMVFGKFYPAQTELQSTEEYLIYDFTKSPAQNRPDGNVNDRTDVGTVIFPPGQKNVPGDNIGVPDYQVHGRGSRFYWAADSRAVLFVDAVPVNRREIVLVTLDDPDTPSAFEHEVSVTDVCGREITGGEIYLRLEGAEIGRDQGNGRSISLDLGSDSSSCPTHALQLHKDDFHPAKTEVHVVEEPKALKILIVDPAIPPQSK